MVKCNSPRPGFYRDLGMEIRSRFGGDSRPKEREKEEKEEKTTLHNKKESSAHREASMEISSSNSKVLLS